ncbi:MAG TPA: DUF2007 domain-containing protein [Candidatus Kapabacteria bacterium]
MNDLTLVATATSEIESEIVKQRLLEEDIPSVVVNRDPTGMMSLNPGMVSEFKIFVSPNHAEEAMKIIDSLEDDIEDDMEFVEEEE